MQNGKQRKTKMAAIRAKPHHQRERKQKNALNSVGSRNNENEMAKHWRKQDYKNWRKPSGRNKKQQKYEKRVPENWKKRKPKHFQKKSRKKSRRRTPKFFHLCPSFVQSRQPMQRLVGEPTSRP